MIIMMSEKNLSNDESLEMNVAISRKKIGNSPYAIQCCTGNGNKPKTYELIKMSHYSIKKEIATVRP